MHPSNLLLNPDYPSFLEYQPPDSLVGWKCAIRLVWHFRYSVLEWQHPSGRLATPGNSNIGCLMQVLVLAVQSQATNMAETTATGCPVWWAAVQHKLWRFGQLVGLFRQAVGGKSPRRFLRFGGSDPHVQVRVQSLDSSQSRTNMNKEER